MTMTAEAKASNVRLLLFDVDGVLTDGVVVMHTDGSESKGFHIRDGAAIVWAQRAGLKVGLLSARSSGATTHRAAQLAVRIVVQGVANTLAAYEQIIRDAGVDEGSGKEQGAGLEIGAAHVVRRRARDRAAPAAAGPVATARGRAARP